MEVKILNKDIKENFIEELLRARGVENPKKFLNPTIEDFQNPDDLSNMDVAVQLIKKTIRSSKPYGLIVDSDVDGQTSAAILYLYLKKVNPNKEIEFYIHEKKEHGFSDCWEKWNERNYDLILSPDGGTNDAEFCEKINTPCLILDHHIQNLPPSSNMVVVNNQISENYKNKALSGAGVVLNFCRRLSREFEIDYSEFYDLAALGICADVMSMLEIENQWICKKGFSNPYNPMFRALIEKQSYSMNGKVNPISVSFYVAPLINALIRMGNYEEKNRLFLSFIEPHRLVPSGKRGEKGAMTQIYTESIRECVNAHSHQNRELDAIEQDLSFKIEKYGLDQNKILFIELEEENFPSELNGISAMRLCQKYQKPTIVARVGTDGYVKGSMRGIENSKMGSFKEFLENSTYFDYVAGHDFASGISIKRDKVENFLDYANKELEGVDFSTPTLIANFEFEIGDARLPELFKEIDSNSSIWGTNNPVPTIHIKPFTLKDWQTLGTNQNTFKAKYNDIELIKFRALDLLDTVKMNCTFECIGECQVNYWKNRATPQLRITEWSVVAPTLSSKYEF